MAELNFGLLTPQGSQSIGNAFVQGMDQAAVARAQENQNALSQYALSKAKREDELTNQLLGDLRNATTDAEIYLAYQRAGKGEVASKLHSDALTRQKLALEIAAQPGLRARTAAQTDADKAKTVRENAKYAYETISRLAALPGGATDQDIIAAISDAGSRGLLSMQEATRVQTALLNATPEKRREALLLMGADAEKRLQALTPDIRQVTTPTGGVDFINFAPFSQGFGQTPTGFTNLPPGMTQFQTGSLDLSQGNLGVTRGRAMDEGIAIPGVGAPPVNAMPGARPMVGRQPVAPGVQQTTAPTTSGLSPAATRRVAEAEAKAQIPTYNKDAGGFITPPTASNPNGTFVPLVAVQTAKDVTANLKALKLSGYDHTTGKDDIAKLINESTGGVLQAGIAGTLGALFNYTTEGAEAISSLGTRVKAMTLSLLDGKLGAGISNADRDFIEGLFGDIANPNIASGKRLAAWNEAKKRMLSLGMLDSSAQPKPAAAAATPTPTPKAAPAIGTIQDGYRFNGGDPSKINSWTKVGG